MTGIPVPVVGLAAAGGLVPVFLGPIGGLWGVGSLSLCFNGAYPSVGRQPETFRA